MELFVRVKPGSRKGPLVEALEDDPYASWAVFVQERAVDGQANDGVIEAIAAHFGVPKSKVTIISGHSSRVKRVSLG